MRHFLLTAAVLFAPCAAVNAQVNAQMPSELIGVWFSDDPVDAAKCAAYLALPSDADPEKRIDALIGGTVIAPNLMHDVAEYGEGNFYQPLAVNPVAPNDWQLETHVSFDTIGDLMAVQPMPLRMTLDDGRLNIVWTSADADPDFGVFLTQCTRDLPAGY